MAKTPASNSFQARIHQIINNATAQIAAAARTAITAELKAAPAPTARGGKGKRKPGRPPAAAAPAAKPTGTGPGKGRRGRKPGAAAGDATDRVLAAIKAAPNQRAEQIQKAVGLPSVQVKAALAKLREARQVKTSGQARGTSYTAA